MRRQRAARRGEASQGLREVVRSSEQCGDPRHRPRCRRGAGLVVQRGLVDGAGVRVRDVDRLRAGVEQRVRPRFGIARFGVEAQRDVAHVEAPSRAAVRDALRAGMASIALSAARLAACLRFASFSSR